MAPTLLIVGAGHAAGQLVASLAQRKADMNIVLVGEEASLPYQRPPLSKKFLSGEMEAGRLLVRPGEFYDHPSITVHTGTRITAIDRSEKVAIAEDGTRFHYDQLVLATGSRARTLDIPGSDLDGVYTLRSIVDVDGIRPELVSGNRLTVVGAGYIGMEVAASAISMGIEVTVIESVGRVMARSVSPFVSGVFEDIHREKGVSLILDGKVSEFCGSGKIDSVRLADGRAIATDAVVVGVGAVPNIELAVDAGLETGDGIVVDTQCRTSDPDVFAIGDCTWHPNPLLDRKLRLESVHNALEQAKTTAAVLCGESSEYAQIPWFWSDQYEYKLQIAGLSDDYDDTVIRGSVEARRFSCLYLKDGRLIAIDAVNSPVDFVQARSLIAEGREVSRMRLENPDTPVKDGII